MMRAPRKTLFAIEAVLDIAYNASAGPVQSVAITKRQKIPRRYLEQVLQQLVRANILTGVRGPRGGYRLAREQRRISVGDIVRAVGIGGTGDNEEEPAGAGSPLGRDVVQPVWQEAHDAFLDRLDNISMQELCSRAHKSDIQRAGTAQPDYAI